MEKKIGSKEVRMGAGAAREAGTQKLSYDELNRACAEMSQQLQQQDKYIQQMRRQAQEMDFMIRSKRLDYLLEVVRLSNANNQYHFAEDFVFNCIREIQESLTISKGEGEDDKGEED